MWGWDVGVIQAKVLSKEQCTNCCVKKHFIFLSIKVCACSQIASEIYQLSELYYCNQRTPRASRRENKLLLLKEGIYMKSLWSGWRHPQLEGVSYQLLLVLDLGTTLSLTVLQLLTCAVTPLWRVHPRCTYKAKGCVWRNDLPRGWTWTSGSPETANSNIVQGHPQKNISV